MKKLFLGSVALVALGLGATAALAAERAVPAPAYAPPPPPVPVYTWTGCYIGGSAGSSSGQSRHTTVANTVLTTGPLTPPAPLLVPTPAGTNIANDFSLSGFIGGAQGGCNYQVGAWVWGVEVDGSATNKEGQNFETAAVPFAGIGSQNFVSQTQERWLVTARGKLGWTIWDKSMVYVTGGGAWAKIDAAEFVVGGANLGSGHQESNTRSGWTVGGGYEYALGYGWSIKGEYLYVKFDDYTTFTSPPFGFGNLAPRQVRLYDNIFRAGMNYKLGWY